jgi:hypothetical protein
MKLQRIGLFFAIPLVLALAPRAEALLAGGGPANADCYAEYGGIDATSTQRGKPVVACTDGESCDADSVAGQCTFTITVCGSNEDPAVACTPQPVTKYSTSRRLRSVLKFPAAGSANNTCAEASTIVVPLGGKGRNKGKKPGKLTFRVVASAASKPKKDVDVIFLVCNPSIKQPICAANPNGGPKEIELTTGKTGTDLDNGTTGTSHNFPIVSGGKVRLCLSGCDTTTNPVCIGNGPTGAGTVNGPTFGAPLPLFAAAVPVCVVNIWKDPAVQGTANIQTGTFDSSVNGTATPIHLSSRVYLTTAFEVCPQCVNGSCRTGAREGQACRVNGTVTVNNPPQARNVLYNLSSDCPPDESTFQATLDITLPLTTGTSTLTGSKPCPGQATDDSCLSGQTCNVPCSTVDSKGGLNQYCCTDGKTACFPTAPDTGIGKIERTGTPGPAQPLWPDPTYPKSTTSGVLVATFCEAKTNSPSIDTTTGLPGPGALGLTGTQCLIMDDAHRCPTQ